MRLGLIGAGNMGGAILRGALKQGFLSSEDVWISDLNEALCQRLKAETGVHIASNNRSLASNCDMILLAVKPVFLNDVIEEINPFIHGKKLLSIAAGWTMQMLCDASGRNAQVLRAMPNTPAMLGEGMTALCAEHTFDVESFSFAKALFEAVGKVAVLPERLFDGFIAVSGSSPAYIFMLIEAMADAAVREGIFRVDAYQMAAQAVLGSAKMALESGKHPGELKDMVCSPGGTTIEAVAALEAKGFRSSIMEAMAACAEKSRSMSNQ